MYTVNIQDYRYNVSLSLLTKKCCNSTDKLPASAKSELFATLFISFKILLIHFLFAESIASKPNLWFIISNSSAKINFLDVFMIPLKLFIIFSSHCVLRCVSISTVLTLSICKLMLINGYVWSILKVILFIYFFCWQK